MSLLYYFQDNLYLDCETYLQQTILSTANSEINCSEKKLVYSMLIEF